MTNPSVLLGLVAVLFQTVDMLLVIAVDTLFLRRLGASWLPFAYVAVNAAAAGVALTVLSLRGLSTFRLALQLTVVFALAALGALPFLDSTSAVAFFLVFLVVRLHDKLCFSWFLTYVQGVFPVREGKQKVARILGASSIACILAGLAVRPLISAAGIRAPFVAAAALSGALVLAMQACARAWPPAAPAAPAAGAPATTGAQRIAGAFAQLSSSSLARNLSATFLLTMMLRLLIEYQFSRTVVQLYPDDVQLASFTGSFKAGMSLAFTLTQLFLTGWLLSRLLAGGTMAALAGVQTAVSAFAVLAPGALPALLLHATWNIGYQACFRPAAGLLLAPLDAGTRDRVGILTSLADSAGCVMAGAFLILFQRSLSARALFAGVAVLYAITLAIARRLNADYLRTLEDSLASGDADQRHSSMQALEAFAPAQVTRELARLLAAPDPALRRAAVERALHLSAGQGMPFVRQALEAERDERLLADLVETLAHPPAAPEQLALAMGYLDHPAQRVQSAAVLAAVRLSRERAPLKLALSRLACLLASPDAGQRAAAAAMLGELRNPAFSGAALACLVDNAEPVRLNAVRALERLRPGPALARLRELSRSDPAPAVRAEAERAARTIEGESVAGMARVLRRLSPAERARVGVYLKSTREAPRFRVLDRVLRLELPALPVELLELVRLEPEAELLAAVEACLAPEALSFAPLAAPLADGRVPRERGLAFLAALACVLPETATFALIEERVAAWRAHAAEPLEARRARLEELLVWVAALESPADPAPLARSLSTALGDDRHRASMSLDLLESRLRPRVFRAVGPLLERWRNDEKP